MTQFLVLETLEPLESSKSREIKTNNVFLMQARWSLYLSRFDFHLTHKPGVTNTQADPLSRISTHLVTDIDDNHDQIVLKPKHFAQVANASIKDSNILE
jgi:hypothetical protein